MSVLSLLSLWILAHNLAHNKTSLNEWTEEWMNGQAGFQSLMGMGTVDSPYISGTTFGSWDVCVGGGGWGEGLAEVEKSLSGSLSGLIFTLMVTPSPGTTCHGTVMSWAVPGSSLCSGGERGACSGGTNDGNYLCWTDSPLNAQRVQQGAALVDTMGWRGFEAEGGGDQEELRYRTKIFCSFAFNSDTEHFQNLLASLQIRIQGYNSIYLYTYLFIHTHTCKYVYTNIYKYQFEYI